MPDTKAPALPATLEGWLRGDGMPDRQREQHVRRLILVLELLRRDKTTFDTLAVTAELGEQAETLRGARG